jgi:signal transduction histidine kinase
MAVEEERLAREETMKDFIDIASHELRHPVTLMKGYALSLMNFWERLDREKMMGMLDAIDQGADRLNRLVLGLLDLSRIERGRFEVDRRETELAQLIEDSVQELRRGGAGNEFEIAVPGRPVVLRVDPERMRELLIILLENAIKFSPPATPIEIEVSPGDGEILVSVRDRGMGVPDDYRETVFERFVQVEDALHHSIPGMGMGLYIAREIVEAHGGRIRCEPRDGGGSVFSFSLPA